MTNDPKEDPIEVYRRETHQNEASRNRVVNRVRRSLAPQLDVELRSAAGASPSSVDRVKARLRGSHDQEPRRLPWMMIGSAAVAAAAIVAVVVVGRAPTAPSESGPVAERAPKPPPPTPETVKPTPPAIVQPQDEENEVVVAKTVVKGQVTGIKVFGGVTQDGAERSIKRLAKTWDRCVDRSGVREVSVALAVDDEGQVRSIKVKGSSGKKFEACVLGSVMASSFEPVTDSVAGVEQPSAGGGVVRFTVKRRE